MIFPPPPNPVLSSECIAERVARYEDARAPLRYPLTIPWHPEPDPRPIPGPHPPGHVRLSHVNAMAADQRMVAAAGPAWVLMEPVPEPPA